VLQPTTHTEACCTAAGSSSSKPQYNSYCGKLLQAQAGSMYSLLTTEKSAAAAATATVLADTVTCALLWTWFVSGHIASCNVIGSGALHLTQPVQCSHELRYKSLLDAFSNDSTQALTSVSTSRHALPALLAGPFHSWLHSTTHTAMC
jgi:hypothetical protein